MMEGRGGFINEDGKVDTKTARSMAGMISFDAAQAVRDGQHSQLRAHAQGSVSALVEMVMRLCDDLDEMREDDRLTRESLRATMLAQQLTQGRQW